MAHAPWFKFYAADYLVDAEVDSIPREAEALLIRMWCICHIEGSCPNNPEEIARKTRCSLQYVLQCKRHCDPLFELQNERLYSHRMEAEKRRSEQARANANERYKQKTSAIGSADGNANGSANGRATSDSDSIGLDSKKFNPTEAAQILCQANGWSGQQMIWTLKDAIEYQAKRMPEATTQQVGEWLVNSYHNHQVSQGKFAVGVQKFFAEGRYQSSQPPKPDGEPYNSDEAVIQEYMKSSGLSRDEVLALFAAPGQVK